MPSKDNSETLAEDIVADLIAAPVEDESGAPPAAPAPEPVTPEVTAAEPATEEPTPLPDKPRRLMSVEERTRLEQEHGKRMAAANGALTPPPEPNLNQTIDFRMPKVTQASLQEKGPLNVHSVDL